MNAARRTAVIAGAAVLAAGAIGAFFAPQAAARAWLLGVVVLSAAPLGALALLMIGTLTAASWAERSRPQLTALAGFTPWLWLLMLPVVICLPLIYPWASSSAPFAYLSWAGFLARTAVALAGWTFLARLYGRGAVSQAWAAAGLVFHAAALCLVPNDWILSRWPGWTTTNLPMAMLTAQLLAATSCILLAARKWDQTAKDISALQIAAALGLTYLTYMAYLVDWYGDLPERVAWWIAHATQGRWALLLVAGAVGCLGAISLRLWSRGPAPAAGAAGLAGLALYFGWMFTDSFAGLVAPIIVCLAAAGAVPLFAAARTNPLPPRETAHG